MRHAQAVDHWPDGDHGRPLTRSGARAVAALAGDDPPGAVRAALAAGCPPPTLVASSSAVRTRQTADGALAALAALGAGDPPGVLVERSLYRASGDDLLAWLWTVPDDDTSLMIVGHNPAVRDLVTELAGALSPDRFGPATIAVVTLDVARWTEVGPGAGQLLFLAQQADPLGRSAD